jgi:Male sterility protein
VYDYPTVQRLTEWVQTALSGSLVSDALENIDVRVAAIQALADKYSLSPFLNGHVAPNGNVRTNGHVANGEVTTNGDVTTNGHVTTNGPVTPEEDIEAGPLSRVIFITGTTGALGCHMLHQLAQETSVARIYAMGRASDTEHLRDRQRSALEGRGLSGVILQTPRIVLIPAETLDNVPEKILEEV